MSETTYGFNTPEKYNYDTATVKVDGGSASLNLIPLPGQTFSEDYSSDTGFTYDNAMVEFSGGEARQIDNYDGSTFVTDFSNGVNANAGEGNLVGTLSGGAVIANSILDLTQADSALMSFNATGKINANVGSIRFTYIPGYNDRPNGFNANILEFENTMDSNLNFTAIRNDVLGRLSVNTRDNTGANIQPENTVFDTFSFVLGQSYDIVYTWDFTAGDHRLFIDDVQIGPTLTQTGTRSDNLTDVGYFSLGWQFKNLASFDKVMIFPTAKYLTPPFDAIPIVPYRYEESCIVSPLETAGGSPDGVLLSIEEWTVVGDNSPRFTFNSSAGTPYWYNHVTMAWELSDTTYAQSNTPDDLIAHLTEFPFEGGTTEFKYGVSFSASNTLRSSIAQLDVEYTHQEYSKTPQEITVNNCCRFWANEMFSFLADATFTATEDVKFIMLLSGTKYWYDGAAWVLSNGTIAQANSAAEIAANITTLTDTRKQIAFEALLYSSDGMATPLLNSVFMSYDEALADPSRLPRLVDINGYIYDNNGPIEGLKIEIRPYRSGFNNPNDNLGGGVFHAYVKRELGTTLADGFFSGGAYLQPDGDFWEFKVGTQWYKGHLPDQDAVDFNELTLTLMED